MIETIKKSKDKDEARVNLVKKFKLSEIQSQAILEMRLSALANLERLKVEQEYKEKMEIIDELESILKSVKKMLGIIKTEVLEIKQKYGDERRTQSGRGRGRRVLNGGPGAGRAHGGDAYDRRLH